MNNKNDFFEKPFLEKRFVNVSVCQSNIKAKKGTYYGKVCKSGRLNAKNLLAILKERAPQFDIALVASAFEQMMDIVLDMVGQGYNVDFFNLGTFSLGINGKIEVNEGKIDKCKEDINYDITDKVNKNVKFAFKFSPSQTLKKSLKNVKMALAIKKHKMPKIEKVENLTPSTSNATSAILKVRGDGLKLLGEKREVGVYIEEKRKYYEHDYGNNYDKREERKENVRRIKVNKDAIIQNENKTLTFVLGECLKEGCEYSIKIVTQGVSGGKMGKELRCGNFGFICEKSAFHTCCCKQYLHIS